MPQDIRPPCGHDLGAPRPPRLRLRRDPGLVPLLGIARRGFCNRCGGNLFWEPVGEDRVSITAGTLDGATGLSIERHIYVEDAGDYYDVPER